MSENAARPQPRQPVRVPKVFGNWKMNNDHTQAAKWLETFVQSNQDWLNRKHEVEPAKVDVAIMPSFTSLLKISEMAQERNLILEFGAQSVSEPKSGPFTGDISASMLAALKCKYVLIGHSEQRRYHPEDDETIAARVKVVLDNGMTPVVCIGETRLGREHGIGIDFALNQLGEAVSLLDADEAKKIIVAYEPVWSIGTGNVPSGTVIESALRAIRDFLAAVYGKYTAEKINVLYGGSVNPENAVGLSHLQDLDGFLVGGASLDPISFAKIWHRCAEESLFKNAVHKERTVRKMDDSIESLSWDEDLAAQSLASKHDDTVAWRTSIALAAYRTIGFGGVLQKANDQGDGHIRDLGIADLREAIWSDRLQIIRDNMVLIKENKIRGEYSVEQWVTEQNDSLDHDEKCDALVKAYAESACRKAYCELQDGSMPYDDFKRVFMIGYWSCYADTKNRHFRRRGIDDHQLPPWKK